MTGSSAPAPVDGRMLRFDEAVAAIALLGGFVFHVWYVMPVWAVVFALGAVGSRYGPFQRLWSGVLARRAGPPGRLEDPRPTRFAYAALGAVLVVATVLWLLGLGFLAWLLTVAAAAHCALHATTGINLSVWARSRFEHPRGGGGTG